jgi:hypothetical protein
VNNEGIHFTNLNEFYDGLKNLINKELNEIDNQVKDYQNHIHNDLVYDEYFIDNELEGLGHRGKKLWQMLTQIEKHLSK